MATTKTPYKMIARWNPPKVGKRKRGPKDYDLWPVCQAALIADLEPCINQSDAELHHKADQQGVAWTVMYLCKDCLLKQDRVVEAQHENEAYPYLYRVFIDCMIPALGVDSTGWDKETRMFGVINISDSSVIDEVPF